MVRGVLCAISFIYAVVITSTELYASDRFALVVGNSQYQQVEFLPNPANDARAVSRKLAKLGFNVTEYHNQTRAQMQSSLRQFSEQLNPGSVALFFYAGHGIQYKGRNYLIPVDADISKAYEIEYQAVDLNMVLSAINEKGPALSIAMLDACRDNPYERQIQGTSRAVGFRGNGLAIIKNTRGTILSYATEPGNVATDGTGIHSPYTSAMLKYLDRPGLSIQDMLNQVGLEVMKLTHGLQKPWFSSSPVPKFCLAGCDANANQYASIANRAPSMPEHRSEVDTTVAERIRLAIIAQDLERLKKLVYLNQQQEFHLEKLFDLYPQLSVNPVPHSVSREGVEKEALVFELVEAVNRGGNRVLPSPGWKKILVRPRD